MLYQVFHKPEKVTNLETDTGETGETVKQTKTVTKATLSAAKASKILGTSIQALLTEGLVTQTLDESETATALRQPIQQQIAVHQAQQTGVHKYSKEILAVQEIFPLSDSLKCFFFNFLMKNINLFILRQLKVT